VNEGCGESVSLSPGDLSDPHTSGPNERIVITERMTKARSLSIALLALALAALVASGCGSSSSGDYGGKHPDYATALAGSPPALAALHKQANELLPGGTEAYEKRIAELKGYPVVANIWASWCGPCRFEFPTLQKLAARYGKRVAFIGVNSQDDSDSAATFLAEAPVPYPSYTDPGTGLIESLGGRGGLPDTAFYDRTGKLLFLRQGAYPDASALEADVRRYALEGG
jgi:cytochrome c biogenesis protein CcmG/thiol:disulfide interchange protein DsbE